MNQDKDNLLVLRVENDEPQQVEARRVQPQPGISLSLDAARYRQALQAQQAAAYAAQQQAPPLTGLGALFASRGIG
jgi:hypothetical protein